jgi:excisionase family DNA binding protein
MMSIADLADTMDVSTKTIQRWIASGALHAHHFGRIVRIAEEDAAAFSAAQRR